MPPQSNFVRLSYRECSITIHAYGRIVLHQVCGSGSCEVAASREVRDGEIATPFTKTLRSSGVSFA